MKPAFILAATVAILLASYADPVARGVLVAAAAIVGAVVALAGVGLALRGRE